MVKRRMGIMAFLLSLVLCFMPYFAMAVSTTSAKEQIDTNKESSMTLSYRGGGVAASGKSVNLYQVAEVSADVKYTLTSSFAPTGLILNGIKTNGEWDVVRSTAEAHILADAIAPVRTAVTDGEGKVHFTDLEPGLYLASDVQMVRDDFTCLFDSVLVALPELHTDGIWQYHVSVTAKSEVLPPITPDEDVQYKVVKLWKGDGGRTDRPSHIEIEIFRNDISYEKKILAEENHWSYSWMAKDDGTKWEVVERNIPDGYTVTVDERKTTFVLTNTMTPDIPDGPGGPQDPPKDPDDPQDPPKDPDDPRDPPKDPDDPQNPPKDPDGPQNPPEDPDDPQNPPEDIPPKEDEPDIPQDPQNPPEDPFLTLDDSDIPRDNMDLLDDSIQTGDTSNILLYMILMFVSGSVLILLGITEKRNHHEEKY